MWDPQTSKCSTLVWFVLKKLRRERRCGEYSGVCRYTVVNMQTKMKGFIWVVWLYISIFSFSLSCMQNVKRKMEIATTEYNNERYCKSELWSVIKSNCPPRIIIEIRWPLHFFFILFYFLKKCISAKHLEFCPKHILSEVRSFVEQAHLPPSLYGLGLSPFQFGPAPLEKLGPVPQKPETKA